MAIDLVREKNERWIKSGVAILALAVFAFNVWNDVQAHMPWDAVVRQEWFIPFMSASLFPGRFAALLPMLIVPIKLWADLHDKPLDLQTLRHLPFVDWMLGAIVLFFLFVVVFAWLRPVFGKGQRKGPPDAAIA